MPVRFSTGTKPCDGALLPGSAGKWVSVEKHARVVFILSQLKTTVDTLQLPSNHKAKLQRWLGLSHISGSESLCTRQEFDALFGQLLAETLQSIPTSLRWTIVAVRHSLPWTMPVHLQLMQPALRIICLFPVAASQRRQVLGSLYQYDGGWRVDGLFLWLGQKQQKGHLEVLRALEDACNSHQAVLVFSRRKQIGTPHEFVGRVRGYLPVADQDIQKREPYRAAFMMDTLSTFEMQHSNQHYQIAPGWTTAATTKKSLHEALGLNPPARYQRVGYSVSDVQGMCQTIQTPLSVLHSS